MAEKTFERTPKDLIIGIAMTLCGGVLWGVNATVSKILMARIMPRRCGSHACANWQPACFSSPARPS